MESKPRLFHWQKFKRGIRFHIIALQKGCHFDTHHSSKPRLASVAGRFRCKSVTINWQITNDGRMNTPQAWIQGKKFDKFISRYWIFKKREKCPKLGHCHFVSQEEEHWDSVSFYIASMRWDIFGRLIAVLGKNYISIIKIARSDY